MAQFGLLINCQQSGNGSYTNQSSSWRNNREPIRVCITANNIFLTLETGSSCLRIHRELEFKAHCVSSRIYSRGLSAQRKEERKETRIRPPLSTLWCIHLIPKRLRAQSSIWQYSLALFQAVINTDAHTHTHSACVTSLSFKVLLRAQTYLPQGRSSASPSVTVDGVEWEITFRSTSVIVNHFYWRASCTQRTFPQSMSISFMLFLPLMVGHLRLKLLSCFDSKFDRKYTLNSGRFS